MRYRGFCHPHISVQARSIKCIGKRMVTFPNGVKMATLTAHKAVRKVDTGAAKSSEFFGHKHDRLPNYKENKSLDRFMMSIVVLLMCPNLVSFVLSLPLRSSSLVSSSICCSDCAICSISRICDTHLNWAAKIVFIRKKWNSIWSVKYIFCMHSHGHIVIHSLRLRAHLEGFSALAILPVGVGYFTFPSPWCFPLSPPQFIHSTRRILIFVIVYNETNRLSTH